jgi:hypothetical protein
VTITSESAKQAEVCNQAPSGWCCTRGAGHEGPCAAVELPVSREWCATNPGSAAHIIYLLAKQIDSRADAAFDVDEMRRLRIALVSSVEPELAGKALAALAPTGAQPSFRDALWLDPECAAAGCCQSLKFKAPAEQTKEPPGEPSRKEKS